MAGTTAAAPGIEPGARRVLVVAPHPDDESLAAGGLLQQALRQGADVTVLLVTYGDNNPWPQRWLERRWRIGPRERERWGARRLAEVRAAVRCLGLPDASLRYLGWPDLGVGRCLLDARAIAQVTAIVRDVAPDLVVLPDLADRHPDHGACHVLVRLAVTGAALHPACLTYLVHGRRGDGIEPCVVALDPCLVEAKRRAVLAHVTQTVLARRRLLAMVGPREYFRRCAPPEHVHPILRSTVAVLPWSPPRWLHPWLRLSIVHSDGNRVWAWRRAPLERAGPMWRLVLPAGVRRAPVFARLESRIASPWIFDHWGWCDLTAVASTGQAVE